MCHCLDCGRLVGQTWDGRCAECLRVYWDPDTLDAADAALLISWSGHDWYTDLGGEGGTE